MEKEKITPKEVASKIVEGLEGTGWDKELRTWWIDSDFRNILKFLLNQVERGERFVPAASKMFRWMKEVPYNRVRVVILVDNVSYFIDNSGIPLHYDDKFDFKGLQIKQVISRKAEYILTSLGVPPKMQHHNRTDWLKQGVLLVPAMGITRKLESIKHNDLWKVFYPRLWEVINRKDVPVVIFEDEVIKEWQDFFEEKNIVRVKTPIYANKIWHEQVNKLLQERGKQPIRWYQKQVTSTGEKTEV